MLSGSRVFIAASALLAATATCGGPGARGSGACRPVYAVQYSTGYRTDAVAIVDRSGKTARIGRDWITREPTFSPDGRWLAVTWFDSIYEGRQTAIAIFEVDSKHRAIVRGTGGGEDPAWSPDGSTVAYAHNDYRAGTQEIRLFDAATGHHNRAVIHQVAGRTSVMSPAWSPDGKRLAFIVDDPFSGPATVWVVDRSGAGLRRVASFTGADKVDRVSWRPDGAALLFSSGTMLDLGTSRVHAITPLASVVLVGNTDRVVYDRAHGELSALGGYRYLPTEGTLHGTRIRDRRDLKDIPPRRGFPNAVVMAATCKA